MPWAQAQLAERSGAAVPLTASKTGTVAVAAERYRVRRGDRLGDLARSYEVSVAELAQVNDLDAPYIIRVGQELRIPADAPGAAPEPAVVASRIRSEQVAAIETPPHGPARGPVRAAPEPKKAGPEARKVAALDVTVAPSGGDGPLPKLRPESKAASLSAGASSSANRYTVRPGETLSQIALRLDVGMSELARANKIGKPYRVYAGQKLDIPKGGAPETTTVHLGKSEGTVRLATGEPPPLNGDDFLWPVNGKVIGAFGPIDQWRRRDGIDIAARRGAPVLAAQDGIVAYAGDGIPGYGQMVLLRHAEGYITTYAHNATILVEVGDVVERGQVIARVGDTGEATQTMLHFELRKGRTPIDPQTRLVSATTTMASTTQ